MSQTSEISFDWDADSLIPISIIVIGFVDEAAWEDDTSKGKQAVRVSFLLDGDLNTLGFLIDSCVSGHCPNDEVEDLFFFLRSCGKKIRVHKGELHEV